MSVIILTHNQASAFSRVLADLPAELVWLEIPLLAPLILSNRLRIQLVPHHCGQAPALVQADTSSILGGIGFDVAERMGLLPDIHREGYTVREARVVEMWWESRSRVPG